jgi:hypothetical protein
MLAFVERQCGVSHTRFLAEPGAGKAAIEALKSWVAREGGVQWPRDPDIKLYKRAVLDAQWRRLLAIGAVTPFAGDPMDGLAGYAAKVTWKHGWEHYTPADLDTVAMALGRKLRAALMHRRETAEHKERVA